MMERLRNITESLGEQVLGLVNEVGAISIFAFKGFISGFNRPFRFHLALQQAEFIGVGSLFIVGLTGFFSGAVFTMQSYKSFSSLGIVSSVGSTTMLAVGRELAPVFTALMVTGRVGSSMATELGTMRVSEQIDAMEVMAVDPMKYLVFPRMVAGCLMVPALTVLFNGIALIGSYMIAVEINGLNAGVFWHDISTLQAYDFFQGIAKSICLGVTVTSIGCYRGYYADGGARGVGIATTQAVVISSVMIFIVDYVVTAMLLPFEP